MAVTFENVRKLALSLGNVEEGTSYGTPAFKTAGVLFVRLRDDIDALVVRVNLDQREEMMAADPETYFITDHYLDCPWILVRLSRVRPDALPDLLRMAWQLAAKRPSPGKKPRASRR
ncbi:MAG TPA: MmcQ/YjbR family DNA-binding protein [Verrucomicrobiae bacterium]|jgi:hypothetical protein|nr:MmcQ/YjbR family DNA-binding protein [Verrucomicrobiae bacterium]